MYKRQNLSSAVKQTKSNSNNITTTATKFSRNSEEYWPQILNDLKQRGKRVLYTNLMGTNAKEINDMTVGIEFPNGMTSFGKLVLDKQENMREISNLVSMACGKEMQIKYIVPEQNTHKVTREENLQNLANESDIPVSYTHLLISKTIAFALLSPINKGISKLLHMFSSSFVSKNSNPGFILIAIISNFFG